MDSRGSGADVRTLFGTNLREFRDHKGLTQTELAERVADDGMTRDKIAKIERGSRPTSIEEALALASALNIRLDEFFMRGPELSDLGHGRALTRELRSAAQALDHAVFAILRSRQQLVDHLKHVRNTHAGDPVFEDWYEAGATAYEGNVPASIIEAATWLAVGPDSRTPATAQGVDPHGDRSAWTQAVLSDESEAFGEDADDG